MHAGVFNQLLMALTPLIGVWPEVQDARKHQPVERYAAAVSVVVSCQWQQVGDLLGCIKNEFAADPTSVESTSQINPVICMERKFAVHVPAVIDVFRLEIIVVLL